MATVWAKSNGNWSDTTLWAFWNEATQQIEDYGQIPQNGDTIYMNGHTVSYPTSSTWSNNLSIENSLISNGENPFTNNSGGQLNYRWSSGETTITCNFECFQGQLLGIKNQNQPSTLNIIGNIYVDAGIFTGASSCRFFNFTGNILMKSGVLVGSANSSGPTLTITGNALSTESSNATLFYTNTLSLTVNGVVGIAQNLVTATVNGKIEMGLNRLLTGTTLNMNGVIKYRSNNNTNGIRFTNLNILNPDTFTWEDITEPRSNPFIIVSNAEMNNRQQYPPEDEVKEGTEYVWGEKVGTYQQPPESVVLKGFRYDNDEKIGTLENQNIVGCVTPEDVRKDVPLVGMGVVGSLVVPSVDDVREGVVFDNGSVGTLIVQGGGDRLRIADFGYYTRSTSITYIVDLTESDKPAFADCEEIVLRSLFPTLDLDNIPDKFFDDLFIQFLRYRLLVEYYRGTSINSKFTPSEPTTEIVNYANTKCEYWLNTANLFLQLWGEKYPNSVKKDRILL